MSTEEGDVWREIKKINTDKRWSNDKSSIEILKRKKIEYKVLNASLSHYKVGDWDFWATTGKFYNQKTKRKGRGVFNLLKELN